MERIGDLLLERAAPPGRSGRPPLLFVHGMHGGSWYWADYLRGAADAGWEAWALNLRGHHGSRPVPDLGKVSVLDYVQDVLDCLQALGKAVLVGHSMGGLIAQKVAEGGGLRAAVLVTSAAPRGITVLRWAIVSRMFRDLRAVLSSSPIAPNRANAEALVLNMLAPELRQQAFDRFVPESGRAARELGFSLVRVDPRRITCPILVVGAQHDRITPAAVQRKIAARYRAEYLEMAGHGHMLMLEDGRERSIRAILDWSERVIRS